MNTLFWTCKASCVTRTTYTCGFRLNQPNSLRVLKAILQKTEGKAIPPHSFL